MKKAKSAHLFLLFCIRYRPKGCRPTVPMSSVTEMGQGLVLAAIWTVVLSRGLLESEEEERYLEEA